jgi:hypothetical protein
MPEIWLMSAVVVVLSLLVLSAIALAAAVEDLDRQHMDEGNESVVRRIRSRPWSSMTGKGIAARLAVAIALLAVGSAAIVEIGT